MRAQRNAHFLDGEQFLNATKTKHPHYLMQQYASASSPGKFSPGITENGNSHIYGEVYETTPQGLAKLDELEQNGVRYKRKKIPLSTGQTAWTYIFIANDTAHEGQPRFQKKNGVYRWMGP